jgi:hypothetical protein
VTVFATVKDPTATKDYMIDWNDPSAPGGPYLTGGDTVTTSTWTVYVNTDNGANLIASTPPGIVVSTSSSAPTTTTVWLSGGIAGVEYLVVNHITTAQGRQEDQTIIILCINT